MIGLTGALEAYYAAHACREAPILAELRAATAKLGGLGKTGLVPWIGGLVLWMAATWAHIPGNGMAAGIWRWVG